MNETASQSVVENLPAASVSHAAVPEPAHHLLDLPGNEDGGDYITTERNHQDNQVLVRTYGLRVASRLQSAATELKQAAASGKIEQIIRDFATANDPSLQLRQLTQLYEGIRALSIEKRAAEVDRLKKVFNENPLATELNL